ncbi:MULTISPECIES: GNAT family N-acetyltransferase [unclassified Streptomyces]|uniref:GNAT family N-acetyltransferase n=1 Tax=unclassified Streptomyces TaxID=2593676 RepID=UPI000DABD419|nr:MULTISPECIES: GNAT family N-acetyltransferase [unclassified Streptomyces]PZT72233.1 hypothetical protein DNK55_27080 [Streptomyces sp. AC1-42T]PZT81445.1 hypothetical protein DNK56_04490 [Streptomyces sp. AC1-42W]
MFHLETDVDKERRALLHQRLRDDNTAHRGSGLGARLLAEAERVAREDRSCARSRVETWDFQAPGFYRKQGYEIRGQVEDFPPGVTQFTLTKNLV